MAFTEVVLNAAADEAASLVTHVSIHTASPGLNGANEVTGGSPAYARQAVTYTAADDGSALINAVEEFNIPAGTTVTHFGLWNAGSAGTFRGGAALSASEAFTNQGVYRLTSQAITAASA